jgi:octaprenyl-diphosphate synthase
MTLPLIYTLNNSDKSVRKELIYIVKNKNEDKKYVKRAIELIHQSGGIQYAAKKMHALKEEALDLIKEIPDSPSKQALIGLVNYSIERKK